MILVRSVNALPRTYTALYMQLGGMDSRKLGKNDRVRRESYINADGAVAVRIVVTYHHTDVVTVYPNDSVEVNTGGFRTFTTKARINSFLPDRVRVYQRAGNWYVRHPDGDFDFYNRLHVAADGTVL